MKKTAIIFLYFLFNVSAIAQTQNFYQASSFKTNLFLHDSATPLHERIIGATLSMTNFIHVVSQTNWLAYDPATRMLSGCVTNTGLIDLSGWSGYPATQSVNQIGQPLPLTTISAPTNTDWNPGYTRGYVTNTGGMMPVYTIYDQNSVQSIFSYDTPPTDVMSYSNITIMCDEFVIGSGLENAWSTSYWFLVIGGVTSDIREGVATSFSSPVYNSIGGDTWGLNLNDISPADLTNMTVNFYVIGGGESNYYAYTANLDPAGWSTPFRVNLYAYYLATNSFGFNDSGKFLVNGAEVLTNSVGTTNAAGIHVEHTPVGYSVNSANVEDHLVGIDGTLTNTMLWETNVTGQIYLKRDGSLAMTGDLSMGGQSIGSINTITTTNLIITGGNPTNGAVWVVTNSAGQGALTQFPKIYARKTLGSVYAGSGATLIDFNVTDFQYGGTWDGTNWTPGVTGWTMIDGQVVIEQTAIDGSVGIRLYKNGVLFNIGSRYIISPTIYAYPSHMFQFYNDSITNSFRLYFNNDTASSITNQSGALSYQTHFSGAVVP